MQRETEQAKGAEKEVSQLQASHRRPFLEPNGQRTRVLFRPRPTPTRKLSVYCLSKQPRDDAFFQGNALFIASWQR